MIDYAAGAGQNVLIVAKQGQGEGTLSLIDIYAGGMMERDVIGTGRFPNDIVFYNGRLYVINSGSNDMNVIRLTYSGEMWADGNVFSLGNRMPQFAALSDSGYIYISNGNNNDVTVFDPDLGVTVNYAAVGTYPADVLALGNKIYVCNTGYDAVNDTFLMGSITVIDGYLNRRITDIEIGERKNPQFMALAPDGTIHVVCSGCRSMTGEIQIIDPATDTVVRYIYIGGSPLQIAITSNGYGYIAAGGWAEGEPGQVYRYNTASGQILNGPDDNAVNDPIRVESGAYRIVAGSDNSIYVACYAGGTVDKIIGGIRVESYPVGPSAAAMVIVER
jgi:DNA-binding beta-propeller fold protein YncE